MRIALALLIVGCQGEPVAEVTDAAGADAAPTDTGGTDAAGETGACDVIAGNLVKNPSFEDGNAQGWGSPLEVVTGGADHCDRWAKLITDKPWGSSSLNVAIAGAAGDLYEFGVSVQRLDDEGELDVFLQTPTAIPETHVMRVVPKGTWARITGELRLTAAVSSLTVGVGANSPNLRTLGIDRVWLRKK